MGSLLKCLPNGRSRESVRLKRIKILHHSAYKLLLPFSLIVTLHLHIVISLMVLINIVKNIVHIVP